MFSIELWFRFVFYALKSIGFFRSPLLVRTDEVLNRALFSGHLKNDGITLRPNAFLINWKSEHGLSVDRASLAPIRSFRALAEASAKRRKVNFYGFAQFAAESLSTIKLEDSWKLRARGVPTVLNPFHSDIEYPQERGKDYYLFIATELKARSTVVG